MGCIHPPILCLLEREPVCIIGINLMEGAKAYKGYLIYPISHIDEAISEASPTHP